MLLVLRTNLSILLSLYVLWQTTRHLIIILGEKSSAVKVGEIFTNFPLTLTKKKLFPNAKIHIQQTRNSIRYYPHQIHPIAEKENGDVMNV